MGEQQEIREQASCSYPYDLESFHYIRESEKPIGEYYTEIGKRIFLDSGAFTMFTKGIHVELSEYADFVKRNATWIDFPASLDIIGRNAEEQSYKNQKELERLGAAVLPVHHARDADKWLQKYIADGYEYLLLGGMVPEKRPYLIRWLDHIWDKYLTRKDGSAKIKVHGLGLTTFELMFRYPWFSVDSASWILHSSYGNIPVDLPGRALPFTIAISKEKKLIHDTDRHYDNVSPAVQKVVRDHIESQGYDVELLRSDYGWRENWNINMYRRLMARPTPVFKRRETDLFA